MFDASRRQSSTRNHSHYIYLADLRPNGHWKFKYEWWLKQNEKYAGKTELLSIRLQIIVMQLDELSVFYYYWGPHAMVCVYVVVVTHPYHLNITEHTSHVINVCVFVHVHMHIPFPLIWLAKCQYVHQTNKSPEAYLCRLHEYMYASINIWTELYIQCKDIADISFVFPYYTTTMKTTHGAMMLL